MGRKTKYTPETVKKVTDAIRLGATYDLAAAYAGISRALFYQWMASKVDFLDAVKDAEGAGAVGWLARIEQAAKDGTWQAAAWKLERRYPEQYGRTVSDHRHKHEVQSEAQRLADELGLTAAEVLAEAESIVGGAR